MTLLHKARLFSRYGLLHVLLLLISAGIYIDMRHLYRVQAVRSAAGSVQGALVQIESSQRGYLLTGNDEYLDNYRHFGKVLRLRMSVLCRTIPQNKANERLCRDINNLMAAKLEEMAETVSLAQAGRPAEAIRIVRTNRGLEYERQIEKRLNSIRTEETGASSTGLGCLVP